MSDQTSNHSKKPRNVTCPACHTRNERGSLFCERCGRKLPRSSQGDGLLVLAVIVLVIAGGFYAYYAGYTVSDVFKFLRLK